jgi:hypothetical protein
MASFSIYVLFDAGCFLSNMIAKNFRFSILSQGVCMRTFWPNIGSNRVATRSDRTLRFLHGSSHTVIRGSSYETSAIPCMPVGLWVSWDPIHGRFTIANRALQHETWLVNLQISSALQTNLRLFQEVSRLTRTVVMPVRSPVSSLRLTFLFK